MALQRGISAFRFALSEPGTVAAHDLYSIRNQQYALGWGAYTNQVFSALASFATHAETNKLHPRTRGLYNPTTRLVDFYAAHVFQGVLSEDGAGLPDGEMLAVPISRDASPELKAAIAQGWQWGNWQQQMGLWVRYGASQGDAVVEIVDDVEAGRVYPEVVPASYIKEVTFDSPARNNVTSYVKEFQAYDLATKQPYTFKKVVTKDTISYYRDDKPFSYDGGDPIRDGYGFCPLVWVKHRNLGTLPGGVAMRSWSKVEELNNLVARVHHYIVVQSKSPTGVSGNGDISAVKLDAKASEDAITLLKINGDATFHEIKGNLDLAAAEARIASQLGEIERDHPEITMYEKLRGMGEVSGVAVERLMGDVRGHVQDARANYDAGSISLFRMKVAIGGMRYAEGKGGWANRTDQRKKFAPFDLDSYERGDLDFSIDPRPLIPESKMERHTSKTAYFNSVAAGNAAGFPTEYQLKQDGASEDELAEYQQAAQSALFDEPALSQRSADDIAGSSVDAGIEAETTLNGAQITAALEIITKLGNDEIETQTAIELLVAVGISRDKAQVMADEAKANPELAAAAISTPNRF